MAKFLKFDQNAARRESSIPVALRDFIDAVIVPALVKEFLAEQEMTKVLVLPDVAVANLPAMQFSSCEVSG